MPTPTSSDDLANLIALHREGLSQPGREHSLKGPSDLSLPDFLAGQRQGWTDHQREQLDRSPYAVRLQKLIWRVTPPSLETLLRWQAGDLPGFEDRAMREHLAEPEGRQSQLLLQSAWWRNLGERIARLRDAGQQWVDLLSRLVWGHGLLPAAALSHAGEERAPFQMRVGDPATLLAVLRPNEDGRLELSIQTRDPARAGQSIEAHLIGIGETLSATVELMALPQGRGAAATHLFEEKLEQLASRMGEDCCLVVVPDESSGHPS